MTDLTKYTDDEITWDIAAYVREYWDDLSCVELKELLLPLYEEYERRHPVRKLYDENGNWRGN